LFIPDPDPDPYFLSIPDPTVKKALNPGSRIRIRNTGKNLLRIFLLFSGGQIKGIGAAGAQRGEGQLRRNFVNSFFKLLYAWYRYLPLA
jgi:hypothetical protein